MELANKKALPLDVVKAISELRKKTRPIAQEHHNIVNYEESNQSIIKFTDKDKDSDFCLEIVNCRLNEEGIALFHIKEKPSNTSTVTTYDSKGNTWNIKDIIAELKDWLNLIKEYNTIHLTEEAEIDAAAEKEVYEMFDFIDEDAGTSAFTLQQQLFLDNALANVEQVLENNQSEHDVATIVEEVKDLRKSIPTATKKTIGKRLSKIFVATKKHSISLFKEVIKEFLKDAIKWGVEGGYHRMIEFFH